MNDLGLAVIHWHIILLNG